MMLERPKLISRSVFLIIGILLVVGNYNFIQNFFYTHGGWYVDAGWYSHLIYKNQLLLPAPNVTKSFYILHFAPLLNLLSGVSFLTPLNRIDYFSAVLALLYGFAVVPLAFATEACVVQLREASPTIRRSVLLGFLLLPFNGIFISAIGYPHFEIFLAANLAGWAICQAIGLTRLSWLFVGLGFLTREDFGIHLAVFGFAIVAADYLASRKFNRSLFIQIHVALAVSVLALVGQRLIRSSLDISNYNSFVDIFIGPGPYAHLTSPAVTERLLNLFQYPLFFILPWIVLVLSGMLLASWHIVLISAAFIPWFAINLLSPQSAKATFYAYDSYPFIVVLIAPLFEIFRGLSIPSQSERKRKAGAILFPFCIFLSTLLFAFKNSVPFNWILSNAVVRADSGSKDRLLRAADALEKNPEYISKFIYDNAFLSLLSEPKSTDCVVELDLHDKLSSQNKPVIFFNSNLLTRNIIIGYALYSGHTSLFNLPGTSVMALLDKKSSTPDLRPLGFTSASIVKNLFLTNYAIEEEGFHAKREDPPGFIAYGPFILLPKGKYTVSWTIEVRKLKEKLMPAFSLDVVSNRGLKKIIDRDYFFPKMDNNAATVVQTIDFEIDAPEDNVEFRVWHHGYAGLIVKDFDIKRRS